MTEMSLLCCNLPTLCFYQCKEEEKKDLIYNDHCYHTNLWNCYTVKHGIWDNLILFLGHSHLYWAPESTLLIPLKWELCIYTDSNVCLQHVKQRSLHMLAGDQPQGPLWTLWVVLSSTCHRIPSTATINLHSFIYRKHSSSLYPDLWCC